MSSTRMALALLTVGILLGIAIWVVSPWLTGTVEPWDADIPVWSLSWLVVAIAGGLVGHVRGAFLPLGYGLGLNAGHHPVRIQQRFRSTRLSVHWGLRSSCGPHYVGSHPVLTLGQPQGTRHSTSHD